MAELFAAEGCSSPQELEKSRRKAAIFLVRIIVTVRVGGWRAMFKDHTFACFLLYLFPSLVHLWRAINYIVLLAQIYFRFMLLLLSARDYHLHSVLKPVLYLRPHHNKDFHVKSMFINCPFFVCFLFSDVFAKKRSKLFITLRGTIPLPPLKCIGDPFSRFRSEVVRRYSDFQVTFWSFDVWRSRKSLTFVWCARPCRNFSWPGSPTVWCRGRRSRSRSGAVGCSGCLLLNYWLMSCLSPVLP